MAQTAVRRKSGLPAWTWGVLVLLVLFGAIVVLFLLRPAASPPPAAEAGATTQPVGDLGEVLSAKDPRAFVGRRAELKGVAVQRVLGDRAFTIGPAADREVLVLLDLKLDTGKMEQRVKVQPGQRLDVQGIFEPVPENARAMAKGDGLSAAETAFLERQAIYLQGRKVTGAQ